MANLNNMEVGKPWWWAKPRDKLLCHLCLIYITCMTYYWLSWFLEFEADLLVCAVPTTFSCRSVIYYPAGSYIPDLNFVGKILNYELISPTGAVGSAVGEFDFSLSWIFTGLFTTPLGIPEILQPATCKHMCYSLQTHSNHAKITYLYIFFNVHTIAIH